MILKMSFNDNMRSREKAALQAEEIIDTQVTHFMDLVRFAGCSFDHPCITRSGTILIQDEVMIQAQKELQKGADPEQGIAECHPNLNQ